MEDKIKKLLSSQLGVEPEDIDLEDSLIQDLHMRPHDLTDFIQGLEENGFDTKDINLETTETVGDIIENINSQDYQQ